MNEEVKTILKEMNLIQKTALTEGLTKEMRENWRDLNKRLNALGYKASKRRVRDGWGRISDVIWSAKPIQSLGRKYSAGNWVRDEHEKNHNSECTTRAIYYALNHEIPYQTIRSMQNARALMKYGRGYCHGWNYETVWGEILKSKGFVKIYASPYRKRMFSGVLAERLAGVDTKVIIHSNHHLAACYRGAVVDDWDSRRKVVLAIYVREEYADTVARTLGWERNYGNAISKAMGWD